MKAFVLVFLGFLLVRAMASPVAEARQALADGLPQVAVHKLSAAGLDDGTPDERELYARALFESGRVAAAVTVLQETEPRSREGSFWLGQSLAALGEPAAALEAFQEAVPEEGTIGRLARVGQARMLRATGDTDGSRSALADAAKWSVSPERTLALLDLADLELDAGDPAAAGRALALVGEPSGPLAGVQREIEGRLALLGGRNAEALEMFSNITPPDAGTAVDAALGAASALAASGDMAGAETHLEEFISRHANLPGLERVFASLSELYRQQAAPSTTELRRWTDQTEASRRRELALFHRARIENRLGRPDVALRLLQEFLSARPTDDLAADAAIEVASARLGLDDVAGAREVLANAPSSPRAEFLLGIARARDGDPEGAAAAFMRAAADATLAREALANAAICEARSGEKEPTALAEFEKRFGEGREAGLLALGVALEHARAGDEAGLPARLAQLAESPVPAVAAAASLAAAERALAAGDLGSARENLLRVSTTDNPSGRAALEVFAADAGADPEAEALARRFLEEHAAAREEPAVRMKLGEILFRKGDFAAARMQFESLARAFPDSEWDEPALFLAGQSASRLMDAESANDALLLFEEVAARNGAFAGRARFQQAVLQAARGRGGEAIGILDRIIESSEDSAARDAARIEKGKILYLAGTDDASKYREAIEIWSPVAADATTPLRNEALARIGAANEKLGDTDAALAAYYGVVRAGASEDPQMFWFYKAGFDAGRLLETAERWEEAIRIYELVAAVDGPRAAEAKARINRIRLENFLWDGD